MGNNILSIISSIASFVVSLILFGLFIWLIIRLQAKMNKAGKNPEVFNAVLPKIDEYLQINESLRIPIYAAQITYPIFYFGFGPAIFSNLKPEFYAEKTGIRYHIAFAKNTIRYEDIEKVESKEISSEKMLIFYKKNSRIIYGFHTSDNVYNSLVDFFRAKGIEVK